MCIGTNTGRNILMHNYKTFATATFTSYHQWISPSSCDWRASRNIVTATVITSTAMRCQCLTLAGSGHELGHCTQIKASTRARQSPRVTAARATAWTATTVRLRGGVKGIFSNIFYVLLERSSSCWGCGWRRLKALSGSIHFAVWSKTAK